MESEELLSNFYASYFAGCILIPKDELIEKTEEYSHQVGHSERTNAVIEPRLSQQWFLSMKEISKPAIDAVVNGTVDVFFNSNEWNTS